MPPKISPPQLKPPSKPTIDSRIPHKVATVAGAKPMITPDHSYTKPLGRHPDNVPDRRTPPDYQRHTGGSPVIAK